MFVLYGCYDLIIYYWAYAVKKKMNDLFRAIFGIPSTDHHEGRMDGRVPPNYSKNLKGNFGDDDDDDDDDDEDNSANMRGGLRGIFGVPLFYDQNEIHQRLEKLVDEMNKAFGVFGFSNGPSITWEDGSNNESTIFREEAEPKHQSLRDAYLKKPDCRCEKISQNNDINVNLKPGIFEQGTSNSTSVQYSYPKVYSKSVFIQTVRRPDGSVETIKKVRDHEGNEETTISQSHVNDPLPTPLEDPVKPKDDTSGISIFKKFFPF